MYLINILPEETLIEKGCLISKALLLSLSFSATTLNKYSFPLIRSSILRLYCDGRTTFTWCQFFVCKSHCSTTYHFIDKRPSDFRFPCYLSAVIWKICYFKGSNWYVCAINLQFNNNICRLWILWFLWSFTSSPRGRPGYRKRSLGLFRQQVESLITTSASSSAGCIITRTLLLEGCAGERISTRCLRPGGTSPLKGASLFVGDVYFSQSIKKETLKCHVLSSLKTPCNCLFWVVSRRPVTRLNFPTRKYISEFK